MKSLVANLNWILLLLIGETRAGPFPVSVDHGEAVVSVALITVRDDPSGSKSEPSRLNVVGCAANADGVSARSKNATINSRFFSISETPNRLGTANSNHRIIFFAFSSISTSRRMVSDVALTHDKFLHDAATRIRSSTYGDTAGANSPMSER